MKRKLFVATLIVATLGLPLTATASEWDCFPMCAEPAKADLKAATPAEPTIDPALAAAHRDVALDTSVSTACNTGLIQSAENLNAQVKPIREIVGYVRSPQGLAIKLVNDYVVKIPAWIGYALDPLGSLKHAAIDKVRTHAKDAMANSLDCDADMSNESFDLVRDIEGAEKANAKHST